STSCGSLPRSGYGSPQRFAGDSARVIRCKKDCGGRNILGVADAAERGFRLDLLGGVAAGDAGGGYAFRLHPSGVDRIGAALARAGLLTLVSLLSGKTESKDSRFRVLRGCARRLLAGQGAEADT